MHRQLSQICPLLSVSQSSCHHFCNLSSLLNSSRMHCTVVGGCWMHCVGWDRGCWCWGSCTARRQQSAAVNRGQLLLLPRTFLVLYLSVFMQISFKHFVSSFQKIDLNVSRGRFAEAFLVLYSRSYRWPCKSFSRFHFVFSFRSDSSQIYLNVLGN